MIISFMFFTPTKSHKSKVGLFLWEGIAMGYYMRCQLGPALTEKTEIDVS